MVQFESSKVSNFSFLRIPLHIEKYHAEFITEKLKFADEKNQETIILSPLCSQICILKVVFYIEKCQDCCFQKIFPNTVLTPRGLFDVSYGSLYNSNLLQNLNQKPEKNVQQKFKFIGAYPLKRKFFSERSALYLTSKIDSVHFTIVIHSRT